MSHYELMLLFSPDRTEQVPEMIELHQKMIERAKGKVHRIEDWGA